MHSNLEKLNLIQNKVKDIIDKKQLKTKPKIIVVTKTFPLINIKLLLENSVAVSEHLNHQQELDSLLHKIATAEEKLSVLKDYNIPKEEM